MSNKLIQSFLEYEEHRNSKTQETNPFNDAMQIDENLKGVRKYQLHRGDLTGDGKVGPDDRRVKELMDNGIPHKIALERVAEMNKEEFVFEDLIILRILAEGFSYDGMLNLLEEMSEEIHEKLIYDILEEIEEFGEVQWINTIQENIMLSEEAEQLDEFIGAAARALSTLGLKAFKAGAGRVAKSAGNAATKAGNKLSTNAAKNAVKAAQSRVRAPLASKLPKLTPGGPVSKVPKKVPGLRNPGVAAAAGGLTVLAGQDIVNTVKGNKAGDNSSNNADSSSTNATKPKFYRGSEAEKADKAATKKAYDAAIASGKTLPSRKFRAPEKTPEQKLAVQQKTANLMASRPEATAKYEKIKAAAQKIKDSKKAQTPTTPAAAPKTQTTTTTPAAAPKTQTPTTTPAAAPKAQATPVVKVSDAEKADARQRAAQAKAMQDFGAINKFFGQKPSQKLVDKAAESLKGRGSRDQSFRMGARGDASGGVKKAKEMQTKGTQMPGWLSTSLSLGSAAPTELAPGTLDPKFKKWQDEQIAKGKGSSNE